MQLIDLILERVLPGYYTYFPIQVINVLLSVKQSLTSKLDAERSGELLGWHFMSIFAI